MRNIRLNLQPLLIGCLLILAACGPIAGTPASQAQVNAASPATEVILFNPESITPGAEQPVLTGECGPSLLVPRDGAYSCIADGGARSDPCFFLVEGLKLGCEPNPVAGRYASLLTARNPLPEIDGGIDPVPFYLNLGPDKPLCAKGVASPTEVDGKVLTWTCQAPGAWIAGELRTDQPAWLADYVVTNTGVTSITYGPEESFVTQAWVY